MCILKEQCKNDKVKMKSCFAFLFDDIFLHKNLKLCTENAHVPLFFMISMFVFMDLNTVYFPKTWRYSF